MASVIPSVNISNDEMTEILLPEQEGSDFTPVTAGMHRCPPGHHVWPGIRCWWIFHYVFSGSGVFRIHEKDYVCHAGDIFVIPPDIITMYEADHDDPWQYAWIGFTSTLGLPYQLPPVLHCPSAEPVFSRISEVLSIEQGQSAFLNARLWDFFSLLIRQKVIQGNKIGNHVDMAIKIMLKEYMNGITIEEIAARLNLNRNYLSHIFKAQTGKSPKQYLNFLQLSDAAALLRNENYSIASVATAVGFSDIFHFSKTFKAFYGMSPSAYVRQYKKTK